MTESNKVDLNSDVGESFGSYTIGMDEEVIPLISSANIACGFHAGDPSVMKRTVTLARENGVASGAHPGLPDLMGFGRRFMDVSMEEIRDYVTYQVGALQAIATRRGETLQHVKPHGALYTMAVQNPDIWETVAKTVSELDKDLILFVLGGPGTSRLEEIGRQYGLRIAFECFADRAYNPDGSLVSRKEPGAVIHDRKLAAQRVLTMVKEGVVECINGEKAEIRAHTICVHGDNPAALGLVKEIRKTLTDNGVEIAPPREFL